MSLDCISFVLTIFLCVTGSSKFLRVSVKSFNSRRQTLLICFEIQRPQSEYTSEAKDLITMASFLHFIWLLRCRQNYTIAEKLLPAQRNLQTISVW